MNIVALVASPRSEANTHRLVRAILDQARKNGASVREHFLNTLSIRGCQACMSCRTRPECAVEDDCAPILEQIAQADAIVLGTPVFMWQMTGQLKLVIDRFFCFLSPDFSSRLKSGKKILFAVTQGQADEHEFQPYFDSVGRMLQFIGFGPHRVLVVGGTHAPNDIAQNPAVPEKARAAAQWLCG